MIIRAPGIPSSFGKTTDILTELVDVFPTLADLSGAGNLQSPDQLDGVSLAPVFRNPALETLPSAGIATANKTFAYSQFPHSTDYSCPFFRQGTCHLTPTDVNLTSHGQLLANRLRNLRGDSNGTHMGFSVRSRRWRYTAWVRLQFDCAKVRCTCVLCVICFDCLCSTLGTVWL